ncbi:MAG: bifunctional 4-hydroxy-2-oxoglutarate aldolase/2-dehydro-3-deoxy-phosphogluconate aldolase [Deltaproteobacteria bacterium]|nr:MAG: bifunctional 4-hydroxy-2-oxoglutarate aldolase/2-dehydro-3-deoxy-phosphogluconate aldolase [Deltaproteobacteria bacterium]
MDRGELIQEMGRTRLVAVVRSKSAEEALATAKAVAQGGVQFIEITFSVPSALDVIEILVAEGRLHVGAGTVLSNEEAEEAIGTGAQFIVSPSLELNLIPICHEANVPCIPGAATPTEILAAARAKADLVKIFPADTIGGPDFVRQMSGPFPNIRFMVSGGVSLTNIKEYVRAGVTGICLGSAYLTSTLAQKGHAGLVGELQQFVNLVDEAQRK